MRHLFLTSDHLIKLRAISSVKIFSTNLHLISFICHSYWSWNYSYIALKVGYFYLKYQLWFTFFFHFLLTLYFKIQNFKICFTRESSKQIIEFIKLDRFSSLGKVQKNRRKLCCFSIDKLVNSILFIIFNTFPQLCC